MKTSGSRRLGPWATLFMAGLCSSSFAVAQGTVVVTGTREPIPTDRMAADVTVIDEPTLRQTLADSIGDVLRREAGVQLSRSGGPGQGTGVFIRGASAGQTVVLVDGVRVGSGTLGFAALEQLGLANVQRIEVLRGPASSIYGPDAVGGVVQIFTQRGEGPPQAQAALAVGGYGSLQGSASVSGSGTSWDGALSVARERSQGVSVLKPGDRFGNYNPDADGYALESAQAKLGFKPRAGHRLGATLVQTRLNAQYDASEFLPPTYSQDPTSDFRNRVTTQVVALDWQGTLSPTIQGQARRSHSVDDAEAGGRKTDRFRSSRDLSMLQLATSRGPWGTGTLAVEQSEERASSTAYLGEVQRKGSAVLLALAGSAGAWSWQADARRDTGLSPHPVNTGRLGAALTVSENLRLRVMVGTTFRAPSFNDLYYPGYGVPGLSPERGRSVEVGGEWRYGGSGLQATAFSHHIRDLVGYESRAAYCPASPAYAYGCARNINRARLEGVTLSGAHRAGPLGLKAQFDLLGARDETTGERLARRAVHQGSWRADWTQGAWVADLALLHLGDRPDGGKLLNSQTTLDVGLRWKWTRGLEWQAKVLNATNRASEPVRDYQGLGRQVWLGLRAQGLW